MQRIWGVVTDNLRPVPYAQVRITDSATGNLSTLYDPNGGLTPSTTIPNPLITDGAGRWMAAVVDGYYTITAQGNGFPTQIIPFWYAGTQGMSPAWGSIAGVLSNQTDLQNALNAKASLSGATFSGGVVATSFAKGGGTSSQFLKADGSVDSNTYLTSLTGSGAAITANTIPKASLVSMSAAGLLGATVAGPVAEVAASSNTGTKYLRDDFTWQTITAGGAVTRVTSADANYTFTGTTDQRLAFTSLTAARTVALVAASTANQLLWIVDETGSASTTNTLTINRAGADTIDGLTSIVINQPYGWVCLEANGGTKWTVIGSNGAYKVNASTVVNFPTYTNSSPADGDRWNDGFNFPMRRVGLTHYPVTSIMTSIARGTISPTSATWTDLFQGTVVGTRTIPANALRVGSTIRVKLWCVVDTNVTNAQIRGRIGSTTGGASSAGFTWSGTSMYCEAVFTVVTTGVTGTAYINTTAIVSAGTSTTSNANSTTVTLNTTASNDVCIQIIETGTPGIFIENETIEVVY